jgi:7-cyano-7-deazaguanine synthase
MSAPPEFPAADSLAVLAGGGADSAVLLGEAAGLYSSVYPLYIRGGHAWEEIELAHLRRLLGAIASPSLRELHILDVPVCDLYPDHWSVTGGPVPDADSPDVAVYLPGRNLLLLTKGLLWCHLNGVPYLAIGTLAANPFPDATPEFFAIAADLVNRSVGGEVRVCRPYARLHKAEVLARGRDLPLVFTFSCLRPIDGRPCGKCNKCGERMKGFREAGMDDPTRYAT